MNMTMKSRLALAALIVLAGCSSSPVPNTYVLSTPVAPVAGVRNETGRPVLELPTVALPDYLDTTDLLLRDGQNELKASTTARWGERLSVGITHALRAELARRLPGMTVVQTPLSGQATQRVLVDVDAFDVLPDGRCVLTAKWTVPGADPASPAITERGTFVTRAAVSPATAGGKATLSDAAIVAAMEAAVDQLGDRIAISVRAAPARPR